MSTPVTRSPPGPPRPAGTAAPITRAGESRPALPWPRGRAPGSRDPRPSGRAGPRAGGVGGPDVFALDLDEQNQQMSPSGAGASCSGRAALFGPLRRVTKEQHIPHPEDQAVKQKWHLEKITGARRRFQRRGACRPRGCSLGGPPQERRITNMPRPPALAPDAHRVCLTHAARVRGSKG